MTVAQEPVQSSNLRVSHLDGLVTCRTGLMKRLHMSLRLAVPQEYNGTLVALSKADKGQGDLQSLQRL